MPWLFNYSLDDCSFVYYLITFVSLLIVWSCFYFRLFCFLSDLGSRIFDLEMYYDDLRGNLQICKLSLNFWVLSVKLYLRTLTKNWSGRRLTTLFEIETRKTNSPTVCRKGCGVLGAMLGVVMAIFVHRRDWREKSPVHIWHATYRRLDSPAFALCGLFPRFCTPHRYELLTNCYSL